MSYRGRIAPSPTGYLHSGHARTFRIAFERAQSHHGTLVLRNDDLDPGRSKPEYTRAMLEDLYWLGIRWSEGPSAAAPFDDVGPYGPYAQSRRRPLYLEAWCRLLASGHLYPCTCSRKDLQRAAQAPHEGTQPASSEPADEERIYPGTCRPGSWSPGTCIPGTCIPGTSASEAGGAVPSSSAIPSPAGVNWRFRVPDGEPIHFTDGHYGSQTFIAGRDFGDFLVWRRDDMPAYQLAVVVDDHLMRITEVVRGQDLLVSTARQFLLYRALGWPIPQWYHCPLVTDHQGRRLSKRHDSLSIRTLRRQGKTPAQILASPPTGLE